MNDLRCYTENDIKATLDAIESLCQNDRKNGYRQVCALCESNSFYCTKKSHPSCDTFKLSEEFKKRMKG